MATSTSTVTVGDECRDIDVGSSVCEIQPGDVLSLRELLLGLMINSGNDAAMTIAKNVGGSVENFVADEELNRRQR